MPTDARVNLPLKGIGLKLASVVVFVVMAALIKIVANHVPAGETVFFRSLFAAPVILVWLIATRTVKAGLTTGDFLGHFWRGLAGTTAMGFSFAGYGLLAAAGSHGAWLCRTVADRHLRRDVSGRGGAGLSHLLRGAWHGGRAGGDVTAPDGPQFRRCRRARGAGGHGGADRRSLCGAGAGVRPAAGLDRVDIGHRLLLLAQLGACWRW
jgi:hypothetical protein